MQPVLRFLKPYRKHLVVGPAFKLTEAVLELIVPVLIARMIDQGVARQDSNYIVRYGLICLVLAVTGMGCAYVCQYTAALASQGFGTDLRSQLMKKIMALSQQDIDRFGTSSLITRLTNDVNLLQQAVAMLIRLVVRAPFLSIGGLVMAMLIDWKLSIIFMVVLPLFVLTLYVVMFFSLPLYKKVQQQLDRLTRQALENLTGVRVIRAFSRQADQNRKFSSLSEQLCQTMIKVGRISSALNPATLLILNGATIAVLWFGGFRIESGALTQGEIIAFANYLAQILQAMIVVANLVVLYTRSFASAQRVSEVLATEPSVIYPEPAAARIKQQLPSAPAGGDLRFEQISFSYPDASAALFSDLNFEIKTGQMIGIIGPTGAGKSTLARLLQRQYDPTAGAILLAGRDLRSWDEDTLRKQLAFVSQRSVLLSGTIAENLRLGKSGLTAEELWWALHLAQAEAFVRELPDGLDARVDRSGKNFSGGQRQRLAIARALLVRPAVLILDDCTSALDYATDAALRKAMAADPRLRQMTRIIISQRVAAIWQADNILLIDDGQLVGMGRHTDLLRDNNLYQEICQSQLNPGGEASS